MMAELDNWLSRSAVCSILLCLLIVAQSTCAQQGFVSIECCAEFNHTDGANNISWITDYSWFPDRRSCKKISSNELVNHTEGYSEARVFDIDSGKRCFSLPTTKGEDYLIRGTFLFGDRFDTSNRSAFSISIGVAEIGIVNSSKNLEVEGIFKATRHHIDFCLVKKEGVPYISKLELRPLQDLDHLQGFPSTVLKLVKRTNLGVKGDDIRFPSDPSDRIWKPRSNLGSKTVAGFVPNPYYNGIVKVPLEVLQTFLTASEKLEILHDDLDSADFNYRLFVYFLELDKTVQPGQRLFDIYLNNELRNSRFEILGNGSNFKEAVFNFRANGHLNLTLIRSSGSILGPICNAYEILQVHIVAEETSQKDAKVIEEVKNALMVLNQQNKVLQSWSGDPCLPVPWDCVSCDSINGSTIIKELDLSSSDLKGPLSSSITMLTNLRTLNLSYNAFAGKIPPFPSSSMLTSVDLSHNYLQGLVPRSLFLLPHLKTLYFGCNLNSVKKLPSSFNASELSTDSGICPNKGPRSLKRGIIIGSIAGGSVLLTAVVGIAVCFYRQKIMSRRRFNSKGLKGHTLGKSVIFSLPSIDDVVVKSISIETFTLEYIEAATQNYKTLIGEGGFGSVYRGILTDGQEVAVKVRSATSTQGTREFDNELNLLSTICHENLVPLLGYCCENDQEILVYPFMSNGSLQDRLYGEAAKRKTLDWPTRLSIALGAARGLTHLHTFDGRCIIHRDVKSSNILLDHSMCAKVADFGFSKYAPQEGDSGASLEVRGTAGYLDPEYYMTHHLSAKSDVFSFGVVLLEIVSGREPLNIHRPRNEWSLVEWAKPYIRELKIEEIVDPNIKGGYHAEAMWRVVEVALACIESFSVNRPCMVDIVRELEDALIIENNASEYMRSIESTGSNNFSIVLEKRIMQPSSSIEPSPIPPQALVPLEPR